MLLPGLVSVTFRQLAPPAVVALARQAGLVGIEWGADVHVPPGIAGRAREVRALTAEAGLQVAAYGSYFRLGLPHSSGCDFGAVLEAAHVLGAPTIRVWAGDRRSGRVSAGERAAMVLELHRIADAAAPAGISISLEYHDHTLTDTAASVAQLLDEVQHPNVRFYWQPPVGVPTTSCIDGLAQVLTRLSHVHVFHWWPTAADRLPLSSGETQWRGYLDRIAAAPADCRRFALLEFVRNDAPEALREDAATLRRLLETGTQAVSGATEAGQTEISGNA